MKIRKIYEKNERITINGTGHWTFARLGYNKESLNCDYELQAHAELLNNDFPLFEGRPCGLKSITQLSSTCPQLRNENSQTSVGILTLDEFSGEMKMKKWDESLVSELKSLSSEQLTDSKIANADFVAANHFYVDERMVRQVKKAGLGFTAWTCNTEHDIKRVLKLGADMIASDKPDLLLKVLKEEGGKNVMKELPKKVLVLGSSALKIGEAGESA